MRIPCHLCGPRDVGEFSYRGDATVTYPALDGGEEAWYAAVYERDNPRGRHTELWHHTGGCRRFLIVERDTLTHEIFAARWPHEAAPKEQPAPATRQAKSAAKTAAKPSGRRAPRRPTARKPRRPGSKA